MKSTLPSRRTADILKMAAIASALTLAGIYLPVITFFTEMVWAVPAIIIAVRYGYLPGVLTIGVTSLIICFMAGPLPALATVIQSGVLALVYAWVFRRRLAPGKGLLIGLITVVATMGGTYFISAYQLGLNPFDFIGQIQASLESSLDFYSQMGYYETGLSEESVRQALSGLVQTILTIYPALFFLSSLTIAGANFLVAHKQLLRGKNDLPVLPPFSHWHLPWWTVWGFILGFGAKLIGAFWPQYDTLADLGLNIMVIYWPVFSILGLAVGTYFIRRAVNFGTALRWLLVIFLLLFFRYAILAFGALGLADLLFNYRRISGQN